MLWCEPLIEVDTPAGRVGYAPVDAAAVPGLFAAGFLTGGAHPLRLGVVDDLPWLRSQTRLVFARVGVVDPLDLDAYRAHGGLVGLTRALAMPPAAIIDEVATSGRRGRGGAGFPTGIKWRTVQNAPSDQKYIACNADEGDSGTFSDRMVMEGDPYGLLEGMILAGLAVGATEGWIYLRSEYPDARPDNGIATRLQARSVPALYLTQPSRRDIRPVGFGLMSDTELLERVATLARDQASNPHPKGGSIP
jgi:formate dehydrogenase iron-sulfur subunit